MQRMRNGLILLLPMLLTVLLAAWVLPMIDLTFRPLLSLVFKQEQLSSTFVVSFGTFLVLILAVIVQAPIIQYFYSWGEDVFKKLPIIGLVYQSLVETTQLVSGNGQKETTQSL